MLTISNKEYLKFKDFLLAHCGIEIPEDKKYLFYTRLTDFFNSGEFTSFTQLYEHLEKENNDILKNRIIEVMTTNETGFFRDKHPFEALKNYILPRLYSNNKKENKPFKLNIWSAGCSTGQEPYSIAIVLKEWACSNDEITAKNFNILATDISQSVLSRAKEGTYSLNEINKGLSKEHQEKYFFVDGDLFRIKDEIKKMINFELLNLSEDLVNKKFNFDIIFCRNVIIYFSEQLKRNIFNFIYSIINPEGYLIVGASENLYGYNNNFETIHAGPTILYKVKK